MLFAQTSSQLMRMHTIKR